MGKIKEIETEIKEHLLNVLGDDDKIHEFSILEFCKDHQLSIEKALSLFLSQKDSEILWSLIRKTDTSKFLQWCVEPVYRAPRELGFQPRVKALFPDYTEFLIIDRTGNSIAPPGKFFTAEEVYEIYHSTVLFLPTPDITDTRI